MTFSKNPVEIVREKPFSEGEVTDVPKLAIMAELSLLVKGVVVIPQLKDKTAILMSTRSSVIDVALGVDSSLVYIGPEDEVYSFTLWETYP